MRIAMVAGEASGDLLAAHLIGALQAELPSARFCGIGGPRMQREDFDAWWPAEKLAVRGYAEVLRHYREIAGIRRQLLARLLRDPPDAFVGIDAPDFNLWLERRLKEQGIPTIHYVSPSIWAWRGDRIHGIARAVSHMLVVFPFEPAIYQKHGIPVTYVGHPLADEIPAGIDRAAVRERLGLAPGTPAFALLPGSRQSEVDYMAGLCIETARVLLSRFPDATFLVPLVSRETRQRFEAEMWRRQAQELPFKLLFGHAQDALAAADAALVTSGTATLETALIGTPMAIAYRLSSFSYRLMRRMHYQPWIGLPNILAGRFIVPEFIQEDASPENLAQALGNLAADKEVRRRLERAFADLHRQLRQGTARRAAEAILPIIGAMR